MHPRIRWGIIATGNIAGQFARDLALLPDHEVVAVGSRSLARAQAYAEEFGVRRAYGSYTDLVSDLDVDVVYVATPHSDHLATARLALEAGKAVLCEKALTANAREARELVTLAQEKRLFFMEAMWMRCNPLHLQLRDLIAGGAIGQPQTLHASMGFLAEYDPEGRLFAPELAGGALLDIGVYPVSLAHHLLGPPATVRATATLAPTGVDASVGMVFGYASGVVATLTGSIAGILPNDAAIGGTEGWIDIPRNFHDTTSLTVHREGKDPETYAVEKHGIGYTYEAIEVARCLREGLVESPLVSWADSLAVMDVLDGVREQIGVQYPNDVHSDDETPP